MKCEKCNNIIPDDSDFCNHCGNKIEKPQEPTTLQCEKCGNTLPLDSEFCHFCGNKIGDIPVEFQTTQIIEQEIQTSKSPRKNKQKYCSKCGGVINRSTKVCEGCGKKYFKMSRIFNKKNLLPIILSVILLISIIANIWLAVDLDLYQDIAWNRLQTIWDLEEENDEWVETCLKFIEKLYFYETYVVIVPDDGTNRYHIYGCDRLGDYDFWAYNTEAAKAKGYKACPYCCD